MKKYLLLFLSIALFSACNGNDDEITLPQYVYIPVTDVELPERFELGEVYDIKITYELPSSCHETFGYEYVPEGNVHYFRMIASYPPDDTNCVDLPGETEEFVWQFPVNQPDLYIFKFWAGGNEDGEAVFITKEVEVVQSTN